MPQLGETVAEGKIVKWFKSAGDAVKPGDNLFEIETDKTSMEVPATFGGTLSEIRFQVGEVAKVGAVVAVISGAGEPPKAANVPARTAKPWSPLARAQAGVQSPAAWVPACAGTNGPKSIVCLSSDGPLPRGAHARAQFWARQTARRRLHHAAGAPAGLRTRHRSCRASPVPARMAVSSPATSKGAAPPAAAMATGASAAQVKALYEGIAYEEVPLDGMRRTIAKRLIEAKQTIPHFYLTADMDAGRLIAMREEANAAAPKDKDGQPAFKLSLNDFIIKAWAAALQRIPAANAVWAEDRILRFTHSDIGIAVAIEGGLITPVIRNAEAEIAHRDLGGNARSRRARPRQKAQAERVSRAAPAPSPISACTACASSRPSSIRRMPPSWRWAPRAAHRSRPRTAASNSSAR